MSIKKRLGMLVATTAMAAVAVGGSTIAPAAAAAGAGPGTATKVTSVAQATSAGYAHLEIYKFGDGNYWITVSGKASVPPSSLTIKLYGDDTFFDNLIWDEWPHKTNADGTFYIEFPLCCSALNEDWGQDEIYAKVVFYYQGSGSKSVLTNVVSGDF